MFMKKIERQERMPQRVEHPHEEDPVKPPSKRCNIVNGEPPEVDVGPADLGGKTGLR